jgi:hypothetical protein
MAFFSEEYYPDVELLIFDGLMGGIANAGDQVFLKIQDAREADQPYTNSSDSFVNGISNYINLYDGNSHYIMFGWRGSSTALSNVTQAIHNSGVIGVDNYLFSPSTNTSISGKSTPLSFVYNNSNKATNWAFGGHYTNQDSATSKSLSNYTVDKVFNGLIEKVIIWDRMLTGDAILNDSTTIYTNTHGQWGAAVTGENPFTGSILKSISANVITYYDFTLDLVGSTTALDRAGTGQLGSQRSPASGHTLNIFSGNLDGRADFILYDSPNNNSTISFPNGVIQFVDDIGSIRNIGSIFYDLGVVILDSEYMKGSNSGLPILTNLSVSSLGFNSNYNVNYVSFDNAIDSQRMLVTAFSDKFQNNVTLNPTGIIRETGEQLLKNDQGAYVSSVGLYNSLNQLLAIAKLNRPIRKDEDHTLTINVNLDF